MKPDVTRSAGDGQQKRFSDESATVCDPETEEGRSVTRQADLDSTDINKIVARFERGGLPLPTGESRFLDVSEVPDFRGAVDQVNRATEYFAGLPARSRALFDNNPAVFLDRVTDPRALELLVEAGVIPRGEVKPVVTPEEEAAAERAALKVERRRRRDVDRELDREDGSAKP